MVKTCKEAYNMMCPKRCVPSDEAAVCVADDCMMWRWFDMSDAEERRGFCGLAGKPVIAK